MKKRLSIVLTAVMLFSLCAFTFHANAASPYALGDVNGDSHVGSDDARLALRASVGLEQYEAGSAAFVAADINRDGHIGSDDARSILRASVGLETLKDNNEFDYLRGGRFYLKGTLTDASGQQMPLDLAVTPDSVYMLTLFEGTSIGMLIKGDKTYMLYPEGKASLELSDVVLAAMGMSQLDLIGAEDLDYSKYVIDQADAVTEEEVNGVSCKVYVYYNDSGSTRFFMNGNKLVRFATYDAEGKPDTVNDVSYITDQVPADRIDPPADYTKYEGVVGMFSFVALLEGTPRVEE